MNTHQISRSDLYQLLWTQTKTKIAAHFGVKLNVINIAAIEMNIPTPQPGHWTKVSIGNESATPPLPEATEFTTEVFDLTPYLLKNKEPPPETIRIPMRHNLHPIAKKNIQYFKKYREWERGMVFPENHDALGFSVTKTSVDRAIRIMNTLIWIFEDKGWEFWSVRPRKPHMKLKIDGVEITFTLKESTKRINHVLTKDEQRRKDLGQSVWHHKYDFIPTGNLTLAIESGYRYCSTSVFTDKKSITVEDQLGLFISQIPIVVEALKAERQQREYQRQKDAIKGQIKYQLSKLIDKEKERRNQLIEDVESWKQAESIRNYLNHHTEYEDSDWASNYADFIDPTTKAKTSIIDAIECLSRRNTFSK